MPIVFFFETNLHLSLSLSQNRLNHTALLGKILDRGCDLVLSKVGMMILPDPVGNPVHPTRTGLVIPRKNGWWGRGRVYRFNKTGPRPDEGSTDPSGLDIYIYIYILFIISHIIYIYIKFPI